MCSKIKVFLLTGLFLLIATAVAAEPFWQFRPGVTLKSTKTKSDGIPTSWVVTTTIVAGSQNVCGKSDYYKVETYNYDNDGQTETDYLRVTETQGWRCDTDQSKEFMFFQTGQEGVTWQYVDNEVDPQNGVRFQIVGAQKFGSQYVIRQQEIEGGQWKPPVFMYFQRGFGLWKEVDQYVNPPTYETAPWVEVRHGFRGRVLYANFTGIGLYAFDYDGNRTWTKINGVVASKMVNSGPNLYAAFTGYGLYLWDGTVWTKINTIIPDTMVAVGWSLYAVFPGYSGLYRFNQNGAWTKINTVTPASMVASGDNLYATFTGYGLYRYDGNWIKINGVIPASMQQGLN